MRKIARAPRLVWRKIRALLSLIHGYDDVRQVYGDNPNGIPEEQRQTAHAVISNSVNVGQSGW